VSVHHSELVGLIPQEALIDSARWYLQLDQFNPEQILETRLAAVQRAAETPATCSTDFLDELATGTPAPGGGSAAAYSGAAAAALVAMVARLTLGKKKYAAVQEQMQSLLERAEILRFELTRAIQRDADAFNAVMAALKLPKDSEEEEAIRLQAVESATLEAARVPLDVAGKAVEVLELAVQAVKDGNLNAISDAATGGALARAALTGAGYNVRTNLVNLTDRASAEALLEQLREAERRADEFEARLRDRLAERGGFSLT
jgi:glutamate formiminotransferase/formiminotetrahydrofolate cyclodeaminase